MSFVLISNTFISANEMSVDEMVDFIVQEQFLSQQEDTCLLYTSDAADE